MKREMIFGIIVGAVLSVGAMWVVSGGGFFSGVSVVTPVISTQQEMAQAPLETTTVQDAPKPDAQTFDALSKEELQTLIVESGQNAIKVGIGRVGPAVVQINVVRPAESKNQLNELLRNDPLFERFFDNSPQPREATGLGSGFFFEYEGQTYVMTNNHVTENATQIEITTEQNWQFTGHVIGADAEIDVALVQVDDFQGKPVPTVKLGDSDRLEIGDWVVAIGNPLGLTHTVTAGIVSALGRNIPNPNTDERFRSLIQTDAAINPGNSGGPLVNARGEVVGINTLIATNAEGLNFSININEVKRSLPSLIATGKLTRAWLGVLIQELNEELVAQLGVPDGQGVLIGDVVPGSPADGALQREDVITRVDGVPVDGIVSLQDEIMFKNVGQSVTLTVVRNRQLIELHITLGEKLSAQEVQSRMTPAPATEPQTLEKFGLHVAPIDAELAQRFRLSTDEGVVVIEVQDASRAQLARLQPGDVILQVNDTPIVGSEDWNAAVGALEESDGVLFKVLRQGRMIFVGIN